MDNENPKLIEFQVDAKDRKFQIWERNPLSIDLLDKKMTEQKIHYIHNNPLQEKWNLSIESNYQIITFFPFCLNAYFPILLSA